MTTSAKSMFKLGEMIIDNKQIFWEMKTCYALIPLIQLLDGRTLLPNYRYIDSSKKTSIIIYTTGTS